MMKDNVRLTPEEFEKEVESVLRKSGEDLRDFKTQRRQILSGSDGDYEIDITARFKALGTEFLVLVECKRYSDAVERHHVQVLHDKLRSMGAQKEMLFSTSEFQKGALIYAQLHRIALIRLIDGRATYFSPQVPEHLRLPCGALVASVDQISSEETAVISYRSIGSGDSNALFESLGLLSGSDSI